MVLLRSWQTGVLAVLLLLTGCGSDERRSVDDPLVAPEGSISQSKVERPSTEQSGASGSADASGSDAAPAKPLDLRLPETLEYDAPGSTMVEAQKLPDLFDREHRKSSVSASAKLLIDEDQPVMTESIDGIEIGLEKRL